MNGKTAKALRRSSGDKNTRKKLKRTWSKRSQEERADMRRANAALAAKERTLPMRNGALIELGPDRGGEPYRGQDG